MIGLLESILCAILAIPVGIVDLLVATLNLVLAGIAAMVQAAVNLLPSMPDPVGAPEEGILRWINWFLPVGPMLAAFVVALGLVAAYLVFKIGVGRWWKLDG